MSGVAERFQGIQMDEMPLLRRLRSGKRPQIEYDNDRNIRTIELRIGITGKPF